MTYYAKILLLCTILCSTSVAVGIEVASNPFKSIRDFFLLSDVCLISNGDIDTDIILPKNVNKTDAEAANILANYLCKLAYKGNVRVKFFGDNSVAKTKIFLQKSQKEPTTLGIPKQDNIKITIASNTIKIEYPNSSRAKNAVGLFLREKCNMRFYAPSELGIVFEKQKKLKLTAGTQTFTDAFISTNIFCGLRNNKDVNDWLLLNGINPALPSFSHNFNKIFSKEFLEENPEIKPRLANGDEKKIFTQPDILNPISVNQATKVADNYFTKNPFAKIFSIGIHDTSEFDERPHTLSKKRGYFRGFPDYSDVVFDFSANVAKQVSKKYPQKLIGCLAYLSCERPPSFLLPYNLVPFITTDRSNYFDSEYKNADLNNLKEWNKKALLFGIYDYSYGAPYYFPRPIQNYLAEGISAAYNIGARAYFAELQPIFPYDAPKCAVVFEMLKNPLSNPSLIEDEFYERFYKSASNPIKKFFEIAKNAWASREKLGVNQRWLSLFRVESSMDIFDDKKINAMQKHLDFAKHLAEISENKIVIERIEKLQDTFNLAKASFKNYKLKTEIYKKINAKAGANEILKLCNLEAESEVEKQTALQKIISDTSYPVPLNISSVNARNTQCHEFAAAYLLKCGMQKDELKNLFGRKTIELAEAINSKSTKNLLEDCGTFESGNLDAWQHYIMDYDGVELNVSEETAKSGKRSVKFLMAENSGISKIFKISQNAKCVLSGWQKGYITLGTSCYASLVFYSKSGKAILRKTFIFPTSEGKYFSKFICAEKAPKGATYVSVSVFASRMKKPDYLFVDDLSFTVSN